MIDLIIPYYKNKEGLCRTLDSIDQTIFTIHIMDDDSNDNIAEELDIPIISFVGNSGPGYMRQYGLYLTANPYVMFLDTGDTFISYKIQQTIPNIINDYPNANIISWQYYHYDKLADRMDNRMHGKLYKRSFIDKYNISFPKNSSYLNEDIGFNRLCRYCTEADNQPIIYIDEPLVQQNWYSNSLTNTNKNISLYRDQTRALSEVSIHTIQMLKYNDIDYTSEINQIAISLYYWFIRTAAECPQYLQEAWSGAQIFYKKYADEIVPNTLILGNSTILKYRKKVWFPINILKFAKEIQQYEIIPNNYLTNL